MASYTIRLDFSTNPKCLDCGIFLVSSAVKVFDRVTHRRHAKGGRCTPCLYMARSLGLESMPTSEFDPEGQICKSCMRFETYDKFPRNLGCSSGYSTLCKLCTRFSQYGLTRTQYEEMLTRQDYRCAVCMVHETDLDNDRLHIDHDHTCCPGNAKKICGKCVRGLLCRPCNMALGFLKDDKEALERALNYVRNHDTNGQ